MSDNLPPAKPDQSPLEQVKEQQAARQQNKEVEEKQIDTTPEVPGKTIPSDIKHHPQRRLG